MTSQEVNQHFEAPDTPGSIEGYASIYFEDVSRYYKELADRFDLSPDVGAPVLDVLADPKVTSDDWFELLTHVQMGHLPISIRYETIDPDTEGQSPEVHIILDFGDEE